ncbi:leucine-rich repeat domain-containing protein [Methylovulum psychrotolerans]|uniref:Internalin-A n=1 Tax=Methylovulum psychrotolerans TaxID=1704499 RepID=A0A2S5CJR2_9GAMM|nr:prenyltransferase/squalene oxidase repeat-containing protein [Methylovulum psychrotolerans]POZ50997.1 Internalin-A [Methylovulum psychrotolerans]
MKFNKVWITLLLSISSAAHADLYDTNIKNAITWLSSKQNADGSWGTSAIDIQPVYTSAVIQAFESASNQQKDYYEGLTWLENHASNNVDLTARFARALISHGDDVSTAQAYLKDAQESVGTAYYGWGLSSNYTSSAIDTALALIAYNKLNQTGVNITGALNYLKSTQHTAANDKGWAINPADSSDPATTAIVVQALALYTGRDTTLSTNITNALNTLAVLVDTNAPPLLQALAAQAAQAAQAAGDSAKTTAFLTNLTNSQAADGSWKWNGDTTTATAGDAYITALATRALATASKLPSLATAVTIPDQALRQAINQALGRNAMDSLNRGQLAQLTSLSAVGKGIDSLTGLEWAVNLTSADLRNNNITDQSPLQNLTQLTTLQLAGNPVTSPGALLANAQGQQASTPVPALPLPGQILLALALAAIMRHIRRFQAC